MNTAEVINAIGSNACELGIVMIGIAIVISAIRGQFISGSIDDKECEENE